MSVATSRALVSRRSYSHLWRLRRQAASPSRAPRSLCVRARRPGAARALLKKNGIRHTRLFFYGPQALAIFLGQQLTSVGKVQLFEYQDPGYVPSIRLRTSCRTSHWGLSFCRVSTRTNCGGSEVQMSFPTADEVALFSLHLRLTGIQKLVTEARPELTELTVVAGLPLALTSRSSSQPGRLSQPSSSSICAWRLHAALVSGITHIRPRAVRFEF